MTRQEQRALYTAAYRRWFDEHGYTIPDDDDGITWGMLLRDGIQDFFGKAFTLVLCLLFGGFTGALVGSVEVGVLLGLVAGGLGLLAFARRPPLGALGRRIDELGRLLGHAPYDARFANSFQTGILIAVAVAFWSGLGALAGLLFGLAPLGALLGGGLALWESFKAAANPEVGYDPETRDAGGVCGTAEAAQNLAHLVEARLSHGDAAQGLFVGTWTTYSTVIVKQRFRRTRSELRRAMHWLRFDQETGGAIIVAPPGTGKGAGVLITTLLTDATHSKLVVDPAAQNGAVTIRWLRKCGHTIRVYSVTGETPDATAKPSQCNPLGGQDLNNAATQTRTRNQAAIIAPKREGGNQEFFSSGAQELAGSGGLFALETLGAAASWPKVAELLHQPPHLLNDWFGAMRHSRFLSVRATGNKFHVPLDEDGKPRGALTTALRNVIETAQTETAFLLDGAIAHLFGGAPSGFTDMKRDLCASFIVAPETASEGQQKAVHLLLETAKADLQTPGGRSVLVLADEACAALPAAAAQTFQSFYALSRKHRIKAVMVAQSWPQLVTWTGSADKANALKASAGLVMFMGSNDPITSAYIRNEAGKFTIYAPNSKPGAEIGIDGGTAPIGVELYDDNALRAMQRNGGALLFLLGSRRVVPVTITPYYRIPELAARAAPDPFHHQA
jgi:type IV secretory pathway TraG/TraD family ATPase VirD4